MAVALGLDGRIYWAIPGRNYGGSAIGGYPADLHAGSIGRANRRRSRQEEIRDACSTIYPSTGAIVGYDIRGGVAVDSAHVYYFGTSWGEKS